MTLPQFFSAATGTIIAIVCAWIFVCQKTRRFKALFWLAVGLTMVYAGFRPHIIELFGADSDQLRIRLVVSLLSFAVLTVTLESIRVGRMKERYAFLWLAAGSLLFLGALFPDLTDGISRVTGMSYNVSVMVVLFSFILFMLFHFSVALSCQHEMIGRVVQEIALLEERVRRVEKELVCKRGTFERDTETES